MYLQLELRIIILLNSATSVIYNICLHCISDQVHVGKSDFFGFLKVLTCKSHKAVPFLYFTRPDPFLIYAFVCWAQYNEVHVQQPLIYSCSVMVCCTYHLSTALQGFSKSSRMSLDTPWAFPSHTGFRSDRFLITLFAGTALLLCMRQRKNRVYNQSRKSSVTDTMLNQLPIHNDIWHVMSF